MTRDRLCMAGLLGVLALTGAAGAGEVLYSNSFESGPLGPEWSGGRTLTQAANFTRFNGRYTNSATVLTLSAVPPPDGKGVGSQHWGNLGGSAGSVGQVGHGGGAGGGGGDDGGDDGDGGGDGGGGGPTTLYTLEFDFYAIDSWDGDDAGHGPDRFEVGLNFSPIFSETFANTHLGQSFRRPDIGPEHLGFSFAWEDSIYRDISVSFTLPEGQQSIRLAFYAMGLQPIADESWGIDNVSLSYTVIPSPSLIPSPAVLPAGGMFLLLGARRRR